MQVFGVSRTSADKLQAGVVEQTLRAFLIYVIQRAGHALHLT